MRRRFSAAARSLDALHSITGDPMDDVMGTPLTLGPTPLGVMEPLI